MKITFKKDSRKGHVLQCIRQDNSSTYTRLHLNMEAHDLGHFAVEKVLDYQKAFYGLVAAGANITDFELSSGQRPDHLAPKQLPVESLQTEHIVNLLMIEFFNDAAPADFLPNLQASLATQNLPFPTKVTPESLDRIRVEYRTLLQRWRGIPEGEILELIWQVDR